MNSDLRTVIMFAVIPYKMAFNRIEKSLVMNVTRFDGYHYTNVPSTLSDEHGFANAGVAAYQFVSMIVDR